MNDGKKNKLGAIIFISFFIFLAVGTLIFNNQLETEKGSYYIQRIQLDIPYRTIIDIEIDYYENLSLNQPAISYFIFNIFNESKIIVNIKWDEKINTSYINFSNSNSSEYALLMNATRTNLNAVHIIILENFTVNGFSESWGHCMFLEQWTDMIENYYNASYLGILVAYDQILKDTDDPLYLVKVICHELGHAMGCNHKNFGVMVQGENESLNAFLIALMLHLYSNPFELFKVYKQFYFSFESLFEMNPYSIWGVHRDLSIYKM